MNDDIRVWIRRRKLKSKCRCRGPCQCRPRYSYDLRWLGSDGRWRSKAAGRDKKVADRAAARLEEELARGTHCEIQRVSWNEFVLEHVKHITGEANRQEAGRTLKEFGDVRKVTDTRRVTFGDIEAFVDHLRSEDVDNATATINKKLRYLRAAFNLAIHRGYMAQNPMKGWRWDKQKKKEHRILRADEETKLIASAERLYGFQMVMFIRFVLETWGRLSEVTGLRWDDVDFENSCVMFRDTKSNEDRYVPFAEGSGLPSDLQRLKVQTLRDGGPFTAYQNRGNTHRKWKRVIEGAGIPPITVHDLRRTGITRALLNNMAPVATQKMAGHANIATTMRYYVQVNRQDLRDAVTKYRKAVAG